MKFIATSDLHISSKIPKNRKGDYFGQVIDKFEFILKTAMKTDSKVLVIAGDFFDSAKVKYKITNKVLILLQKYKDVRVLAIPGQHDLNYHTGGLINTPLGILETAKVVHILKPDTIIKINGISFIGCGWNEVPKTEADVLVMHLMVVKKEALWADQTNYSTAHAILRKYPWAQLIISGDNHLPHYLKTKKGKLQINCGSMMRTTKAQIHHQPKCWAIDTMKWKAKPIKIPCEPAKQCFDFAKITIEEIKDDAKKEAKEKIQEFINTLPQNDRERPNFNKILNNVVAQAKPKNKVKTIINDTMERIAI